jgi:hypothetical protein
MGDSESGLSIFSNEQPVSASIQRLMQYLKIRSVVVNKQYLLELIVIVFRWGQIIAHTRLLLSGGSLIEFISQLQ